MYSFSTSESVSQTSPKIAVIGGGVAGVTIALRLAELGIDTSLFEKNTGLVSGPPFCHLHAGGNLYRDISDEQCLLLLKQSIDTLKIYRHCVNWRPTVIALPVWDKQSPKDLLPRLNLLKEQYRKLVSQDVTNQVLGEPEEYFELFEESEIQQLAQRNYPKEPQSAADWLVPLAKQLDFSKIQFPLLVVQEYGLSAFRFSATAHLAFEKLHACHLYLGHEIVGAKALSGGLSGKQFELKVSSADVESRHFCFDFIINACGFKSGVLDDMLGIPRQRMVEFKAAYVAKWEEAQGLWPEVIFHGERGTPQGMAQLTPYQDNFFQLHGMTDVITLFKDGLVASNANSAQPQLAQHLLEKIDRSWHKKDVDTRTRAAINHLAQFIPTFTTANVGAKPLFGAQQIPGGDPSLRAADVSFWGSHYARTEIVKASSAITAADEVLKKLVDAGFVCDGSAQNNLEKHYFPVTQSCKKEDVDNMAQTIAKVREYPAALAKQVHDLSSKQSQL